MTEIDGWTRTLAEMATEARPPPDGRAKTALSRGTRPHGRPAARAGERGFRSGVTEPPLRPARPERPELLPPRDVPRRNPGLRGRPPRHASCRGPYRTQCRRPALGPGRPLFPDPLPARLLRRLGSRAADEEGPSTSTCSATASRRAAAHYGACPPMPACGARQRTRRRTSSPASPLVPMVARGPRPRRDPPA